MFNSVANTVMGLIFDLQSKFNKGVRGEDLADGAITAIQIADGVITPVKLLPGLIPASERQMIWQGYKEYSINNSQFLSAVPGQLKVSLLGATVPFIGTISGGFDKTKQIDYVIGIDSDVIGVWELPPDKSFLQLFIEYNPSTKNISYGYTELECAYLYPSAPANGQHWYDKGNLEKMQVWNGSAWESKARLFVGEAVTGASSVTSVISYAIQCEFDSGWVAVGASQNKTLNHNIGIRIPDGLEPQFYYSLDSAGADATFAHDIFSTGSTPVYYGHFIRENVVQATRNILKFGFNNDTQYYKAAAQTGGYYRVILRRAW